MLVNGLSRYRNLVQTLSNRCKERHLQHVQKEPWIVIWSRMGNGIWFQYSEHNIYFARGLGNGLGYIFPQLSQKIQEEAFDDVKKNHAFMQGLGSGLGFTFSYANKEIQQKALNMTERHDKFGEGLGYRLGYGFPYQPDDVPANPNAEICGHAFQSAIPFC